MNCNPSMEGIDKTSAFEGTLRKRVVQVTAYADELALLAKNTNQRINENSIQG